MPKLDTSLSSLIVAAVLATGVVLGVKQLHATDRSAEAAGKHIVVAQASSAPATTAAESSLPEGTWAATAAGRVEPRGGEVKLSPEVAGIVTDVYVAVGDQVKAGDLLFKLRDDELRARRETARTEIDVRLRERAEDPSVEEDPKAAEAAKPRLDAEDAVGDAEVAVYDARRAVDEAYVAWRRGTGAEDAVTTAKEQLATAETKLDEARKALVEVRARPDTPLPTRLQGGLETSRDDLRLVEIALERTKVRAPVDGTLLEFDVRVGEAVSPSPLNPVARIGDISQLTVRSEIEERDMNAVKVGQKTIVRSNAYPGRDFTGTVSRLSPSLAAPKLSGRGPRQLADVDVIELTIDLDGNPPLLPGMRVDVFFKKVDDKQAQAQSKS